MKYIYIYIFFLFSFYFKGQVRFNVRTNIGMDTVADLGHRVIQLKNKGYLTCGTSDGFMINYKAAYLVKTDSVGNLLWKKQYDFSVGGSDFFTGIIELVDSNYLLLGITTNTVTNDDDAFLCKIDTAGNVLWLKKYMYADEDEAVDFKLTPDGNIIIVGYTWIPQVTSTNVLLIKTDLNGNLIWRKVLAGGNYKHDQYYSIDVIKNNSEYILSGMQGYYNTGNPYYDFTVMRTDTAGNELWQKQYGDTLVDENGKGGIPTLDGGYIMCGSYNGEGAIIKLDKQGNWQWFKNYNLYPGYTIVQVKQLPDSGYAMITSTSDYCSMSYTGLLIRADKNGDMLWTRAYAGVPNNGGNFFYAFNTTADKGFIITGEFGHIGQPYSNTWLVKTDSLGNDSAGSCLVTSVKEERMKSEDVSGFSLWPNPVNDVLTIEITNLLNVTELMNNASTPLSVTLTNALGVVVINELVSTKYFTVKTQNLDNGIYFVQLYANTKLMATKKVVVQR